MSTVERFNKVFKTLQQQVIPKGKSTFSNYFLINNYPFKNCLIITDSQEERLIPEPVLNPQKKLKNQRTY
jgi:hypothetical protein